MNTNTDAPSASSQSGPSSPRRRGALKRVLAWTLGTLLLLVVAVAILGPILVPKIARGQILAAIKNQTNGTAELKDVSFSWPARLTVTGLVIADERGERVISVQEVAAEASLFKAITGSYVVDVKITGPEVHAREDAQGRLNLERLFSAGGGGAAPAPRPQRPERPPAEPQTSPKPAAPVPVPTVVVQLSVTGGRLSFVARDGAATRIDDLVVHAAMDTIDRPLSFDVALKSGQGAQLKLDGQLTLGRNSCLEVDRVHGHVGYAIERLDLQELKPLVAAFAGIEKLAGMVQGSGRYDLRSATSLSGKGDLRIDGLTVSGPAIGPEPVAFTRVHFSDEIVLDERGAGKPVVRLEIDDFLKASLDGELTAPAADRKGYTGKLAITSDLAGLSKAAGSLLKLKAGYRLQGSAAITADLAATQEHDRLAAGNVLLRLQMEKLAVFDGAGQKLPVDPEMTLDLEARHQAPATTQVSKCELRMGSVDVKAGGGYDSDRQAISESFVKAEADLDDLARKLTSFLDLPFSFGGKVKIDSRVESAGDAAKATSLITVTQLRMINVGGKNLGPLDLTIDQAGTVNLKPGGRSTLERFNLRSRSVEIDATGEGTDVADAAKVAASGAITVRGDPAAMQAQFGDFLGGLALAGAPLTLQATAGVKDQAVTFKGEGQAPNLAVNGPSFGPGGLTLTNVSLSFDGALDRRSQDLDLRALLVKSDGIRAVLKDSPRPVDVRGLLLQAAGLKKGDDLELRDLKLASNLGAGGGSATIRKLGKEGMSATGEIALRGDCAPLVDLARAFVPELKDAVASGQWEVSLKSATSGQEISITPDVKITKFSLDGMKVGDQAATVRDADIRLASDVAVDSRGAGVATVKSFALTAPGVEVKGQGSSRGFLGTGGQVENAYQVTGTLQPEEITRRCSAFLMGYATAGQPVTFAADLRQGGAVTAANGRLQAPALTVTLPPDPAAPGSGSRVVSQKDLAADFDLARDATAGRESLLIKSAKFASTTAKASLQGQLLGKDLDQADMTLNADAELADVLRDLGALLKLTDYDLRGRTTVVGSMKGTGGTLKITGNTTIKDLFVAATPEGREKVTVTEPQVKLDVDAESTSRTSSLLLNKVQLDSGFLRGTLVGRMLNLATEPEFQGIKGDFTYHPEKLGAVIKPWFSGTLSGTELKKIAFTLNGKARETHWISVLRGSTGNGSVDLAPLAMSGFNVQGNLGLNIKDEQVTTDSALALNGGDLKLGGKLDLRQQPDAASQMKVNLRHGAANNQLGPVLEMLSPLFAMAQGGSGGIQGFVDADVDLAYNGPLTKEAVAGGWDAFPKQPINGKGRIALSDLVVQGSNFIGQALPFLGLGDPGKLTVDPFEFTVKDGRLFYDRPMGFGMGDFRTAMSGSIGLDKTLDIIWEVPVNDQLVAKHGFLRFWKGQGIKIPVGGTTSDPKLKIQETLASLATEAVKKELAEKAGGALPGPLGGLLGGGQKPPPAGEKPPPVGETPPPGGQTPPPPPPGGQNPPPAGGEKPPPPKDPVDDVLGGLLGGDEKKAEKTLGDADKLYGEGKKAEAAKLYKKLADKYKKTDAYKKNKERVDARAKEQ